jgi:pimeloyl-ACP methyl ester carboxylesterase
MPGVNLMYTAKWGDGDRVVLVHRGRLGEGGTALAAEKDLQQRWRLVLSDRLGHGQTPRQGREDFERDVVGPAAEASSASQWQFCDLRQSGPQP